MRVVAASLLLALGAAGCGSTASSPLSSACVSRFDCASNEVCEGGRCISSTIVVPKDDASVSADAAADAAVSHADATVPPTDGGGGGPDAVVVADSGVFPDAAPLPDSGPADAGCAGPRVQIAGGAAFCTIGAAIAAAMPNDTIQVPAGTFAESLDISKTLTLQGVPSSGGGVSPTVLNGLAGSPAIRLNASGVVITGFSISASNAVGVEAAGQSSLTDVAITQAVGAGVRALGSNTSVTLTNVKISGVTADGAGDGLGVDLSSGTTCTISNSAISDTYSMGIGAYNATVIVHGTSVTHTGHGTCNSSPDGCWPGILVTSNSSLTIDQQSSITNSGAAGVAAVGSLLDMRDSTSNNNGTRNDLPVDGVYIDTPTQASVVNNNLSNNRGYGVECWMARLQSCTNNTHTNNTAGWTNCQDC